VPLNWEMTAISWASSVPEGKACAQWLDGVLRLGMRGARDGPSL